MQQKKYRVYIKKHDQQIVDIYNTQSKKKAVDRFTCLVNETQYDGQKISAVISYDNKQIAFHRFDKPASSAQCWRGRTHELLITTSRAVGRPVTIGAVRKNISISPEMWDVAIKIGNGNASSGISRALSMYK